MEYFEVKMNNNIDKKTVNGFGYQWTTYDQDGLINEEYDEIFESYFKIFPFDRLPEDSVGFDMGCGTGRWARGIVPKVGKLYCIDPSEDALNVAKDKLAHFNNVEFLNYGVNDVSLEKNSVDFGYSLGVLHHIPNTLEGIKKCVNFIKPNGYFLVYLYYSLDNKPLWYKQIWKASNLIRRLISKLPNSLKLFVTQCIALTVYYPIARIALISEKLGLNINHFPLSAYRNKSFYTMKTDAFDRFATRLEHRFSKVEIEDMMKEAGLKNIKFSDSVPFWVAIGQK